jgi:pimeloyl-ACP methyl ester carboxylesterase
MGDSWRSFWPVLERLPPHVHWFAVSPRGHGGSDHPSTGFTVDDYAADLVAFLDALTIRRAVLVGHSSSTFPERVVAARLPARVAGLVLVGAPLTMSGSTEAKRFSDAVLAGLQDPVSDEFVHELGALTVGAPLPDALAAMLARDNKLVPARVWQQTFAGLLAHDGIAGLDRISCPVQLVWGDADPLVGAAEQASLCARLPRATVSVVPGAGHSPHWQDPRLVAVQLEAFLASLSGAPPRR